MSPADEDLGAGVAQGADAGVVDAGSGDDEDRGPVEGREELGVEWQSGLSVEDDAKRLARGACGSPL